MGDREFLQRLNDIIAPVTRAWQDFDGGETVYVARGYNSGLTQDQYDSLDKKIRETRNWQVMKRNMDVWVMGKIRHSDHATIIVNGWHKVYSNTENLSEAMRNITFLD